MTPEEMSEIKKQLQVVTEGLDSFGKKVGELSQKLPSKSMIEELTEPLRMLHAQRKKALWAVIVFAGITLAWLLLLSLLFMFRPTSSEGLAIALAPALVWLGVGASVLRWVRAIR